MSEYSPAVDAYIALQPDDVQAVLHEIRRTIHDAVPDAGEMISYDIPTVTLGGRYVVYFAAWKHHISVYPVPHADKELASELEPYLAGKGTLKFVLAKPIPYGMIGRVAAQLAAEKDRRG
ncbi:iron chaperone [Paenarthrobacter sp. NyZ202]|uniref:iron chaperone n=1 Tax=Paenarthrobacter sp. NyZ202 TaxID=3402689 RepID=UPI003CF46F63